MFDHAAAQRAAATVLATAPRIDGGDGTEYVVPLKKLVDDIIAAGNPDALVVPAYDAALASTAHYRIEMPTEDSPGATMSVRAHVDMVLLAVHDGAGGPLIAGFIGHEFVWHLGMALCSAAQEAKRLREAQQTEARS